MTERSIHSVLRLHVVVLDSHAEDRKYHSRTFAAADACESGMSRGAAVNMRQANKRNKARSTKEMTTYAEDSLERMH